MQKLFWTRSIALYIALAALGLLLAPSALAQGGAQLKFNPSSGSVAVGDTIVVAIEIESVTDLYGYQFQVNYNPARVSAVGAFVNTFLDTTSDRFIPTGWNAACAGGVCKFAVTRLNNVPALTGSGTVAQITFTGVSAGSVPLTSSSNILADRNGSQISHTAGSGSLSVYAPPGATTLEFNPTANSVAVGNVVVVSIDISSVTDLYGYQFQVSYDATRVSASGSFINSFFDTTGATFIPPGWNGVCSAGICKFAASHLNTAAPISGSGTVAQITFTGVSPGLVPLAFALDILSDRNGVPIPHSSGNASILVYAAPPGGTQLVFNPTSSTVAVGNSVVVLMDLQSVSNLYGYQFQVNYDATKVSASGSFVNSFFNTSSDSFIPPGWNAACAAGVCKFAVTHQLPASPLTGSGTLAQITFTGTNAGTVPLSFSADILSDRDGNVIPHTNGTATITVYGFATISGTVQLQGRLTPVSTGTVTMTDASNTFPPTVVTFSAVTGNYTASVPALAGGTTYNLAAKHSLYLRNELNGVAVLPGASYPQATTLLRGGDGTNDGVVDVLDLACVGGGYGVPPTTCALTGNSDLNEDGVVDVFDLVLVGGNYGLSSPQPW